MLFEVKMDHAEILNYIVDPIFQIQTIRITKYQQRFQ